VLVARAHELEGVAGREVRVWGQISAQAEVVLDDVPEIEIEVLYHMRIDVVIYVLAVVLMSGAVAAEIGLFLVQRHLVAALGKSQCGRQPGDAAAYDGYADWPV